MDVFPIQRWKTVQQAGFGHFGATNSAKKIVTDRLFFKSNYFLYTYETYLGRRCEGAMGAVKWHYAYIRAKWQLFLLAKYAQLHPGAEKTLKWLKEWRTRLPNIANEESGTNLTGS